MSRTDLRGKNILFSSHHTINIPQSSLELISASEPSVPLSIFVTRLSPLQALVRYLRETSHTFHEIAKVLNRSEKTVWASHHQSANLPFSFSEGGLTIPIGRFATREFAPLETLVIYLAELGFSNRDTARILNLDPRTTWTAKSRAIKKGVKMR